MKLRLFKAENGLPRVVLESHDFPYPSVTLASLPQRIRGEKLANPVFEEALIQSDLDELILQKVKTPAEALAVLADKNEIGPKVTEEALLKLYFTFMIAEDPHRRLDIGPITPLAHQVSLVQHITSNQPHLNRVLVGDEVGLGKTIEAGLLIREFLKSKPGGKVLYLTPARLVPGATRELQNMDLPFRAWLSNVQQLKDIRIGVPSDPLLVASIHRACLEQYVNVIASQRWEMLIVDECHHLSAWEPMGGSPTQKYRLIERIIENMAAPGKLVLLSGTPHQGNVNRFNNLLSLLEPNFQNNRQDVNGKIIYRLKEDVTDWNGKPLFPKRDVRSPRVIDLGEEMIRWFHLIYQAFDPESDDSQVPENLRRAKTWRQAQAMQWAASSIEAGLAYLVRQAIRAGLHYSDPTLGEALKSIRPYRGGHKNESIHELYQRIVDQIGGTVVQQENEEDDFDEIPVSNIPNEEIFLEALVVGTSLANGPQAKAKWEYLFKEVLHDIKDEKVVLFAQPIETVLAFKRYVEEIYQKKCSLVIGGQDLQTRDLEIEKFRNNSEFQYLISSRAGGEGINLQNSRRLVHLDVPWNPMEMEQRVGRVHRFGSTQTIIVETLVLRNSREEHIYSVARNKLHLIADTMGGDIKFETIYSRVMSLIPPEELGQIIMTNPSGNLSPDDEDRLSDLIQNGFDSWREFHEIYTEKKRLEVLPGQSTWEDLSYVIENHLGGQKISGFTIPKFYRNDEGTIQTSEQPVEAFKIDNNFFSINELGGLKAKSSDGVTASPIGLNNQKFIELFRNLLTTNDGSGFFRIDAQDVAVSKGDYQLLGFLSTEIRSNSNAMGGNEEGLTNLRLFLISSPENYKELTASEIAVLLRNTIRKKTLIRKPKLNISSENLIRLENDIFKKILLENAEKRKKVSVFPIAAFGIEIV